MSMNIDQIAAEALLLPVEERAILADKLVESLDAIEDGALKQLWSAEAIRRRDEIRNSTVRTVPFEQAMIQARNTTSR